MSLFEVTERDKQFYEEHLKDFLPPKLLDIHTHVHLRHEKPMEEDAEKRRTVAWPAMVAADNCIEDLNETYRLMFPDKEVSAMIFGNLKKGDDYAEANRYVSESAQRFGYPSLYFSVPEETAEEIEQKVLDGTFLGLKSYLSFAAEYLPEKEMRIFDFFPYHQLEVCNQYGWIVMLHIPRDGRLKDPVNLAQILEIKKRYPNLKLIIAHVGRAYCPEDVGDAFEVLAEAPDLLFDFCANCNEWVFEQLIKAVGPKRILFGSDMPILRMRTKRICENGKYINLVPKGLYGDVSKDSHLREVSEEEGKNLTFFMYEEIYAMKQAAQACGLSKEDVADMFYNNAKNLTDAVRIATYGK